MLRLIFTLLLSVATYVATQEASGYGPPSNTPTTCTAGETTTITATSFECCGTIAGATVTSYTDCRGCALEYFPTPLCRCGSVPVTDTAITSTETACAPSASTKCQTTITYTNNACGDCSHTYAKTKTHHVDCKGCKLRATTTTPDFGICMCPIATATTVTACQKSPS